MNTQLDENELNNGLKKRLFWVLVITACIANMMGFISNGIMYGMSLPTVVCGICELIVIICGAVGINFDKQKAAAIIMVILMVMFEFPFLFYVYGATMGVYMVLGIAALAIYFPKPYHIPAIIFSILSDVAVMALHYGHPGVFGTVNDENNFGMMHCSYMIVAVAIAVILCNLVKQYEQQHKHILDVSMKLKYAAERDALTGVYNRGFLVDTLKHWMSAEDKYFLVALIDIDNFKKINDTYGHVYGDEVLIELTRLMKQEMEGRGIAARYGGEEFMLLFEEADRRAALDVLERIKSGMGEFSRKTRQITITFSGGVEEYRTGARVDELFHNVDKKLYQAKKNGKNQVVYEGVCGNGDN